MKALRPSSAMQYCSFSKAAIDFGFKKRINHHSKFIRVILVLNFFSLVHENNVSVCFGVQ